MRPLLSKIRPLCNLVVEGGLIDVVEGVVVVVVVGSVVVEVFVAVVGSTVVVVVAVAVDTDVAPDVVVIGVVDADVDSVLDMEGFSVEASVVLITVIFSIISLVPVLVTSVPLFVETLIFVIVDDGSGLVVKIMGTLGLSWPINSMIPNSGIRLISSDGVV